MSKLNRVQTRRHKKEELLYGSNSDLKCDGNDTESQARIDNINMNMLHQQQMAINVTLL